MCKIGKGYLEASRAQMLVFIYMANSYVIQEEAKLSNDSFMTLLCAIGVYLLAIKNRPILSAIVFSVAISLKAGAVLYLPALLGTI